MKRITSFVMLVVLLSGSLIACNTNTSKTSTPAQTDTTAKLAKDEIYTCKMHPEVMSDRPGKCSKCGDVLVKQKVTADQMKMMKEGTYTKQ